MAIPGLAMTAMATPNLTFNITFATNKLPNPAPTVGSNFKEGIYLIGFNSAWKRLCCYFIYLIVYIKRISSSTKSICPFLCPRNCPSDSQPHLTPVNSF